jgi:hypothetical protein
MIFNGSVSNGMVICREHGLTESTFGIIRFRIEVIKRIVESESDKYAANCARERWTVLTQRLGERKRTRLPGTGEGHSHHICYRVGLFLVPVLKI